MLPPVPSFADLESPLTPRRHQREAIDAVLAASASGSTRWRVTLPPGAGKTLVGTEVARLLGRRTVVLSPNTAIQGQWLRTWEAYDGPPASTKRDLRLGFTSLTYQSLAVFDEGRREAGGGEPDPEPLSHVERLHENGRALVETMREAGPLLLVLDECHHLLEVWGELLREVLDSLPDAVVLGLTATPPEAMTQAETELTDALLGPVLYEARLPALVAEGVLAPYVELAWVVEPTQDEGDWLAGQSRRFEELTAALFAPDFGSTTLPVWLQQRFVEPTADGTTTWESLAAGQPGLADAVLRLAHQDLVPLPEGAVLRERHREAPDAEDWRLVIDDWLRGCIQPRSEGEGPEPDDVKESDARVLQAVRAALPSIGYVWTSRGIRAGRGTVDRVTARSRAKETAVTQVVGAELAHLGSQARVLVLCDHERATATTGAHLGERSGDSEPPPRPAGSATGVLETLVGDAVASGLDPVLVTGRTVAGAPATLRRFVEWLAETHPMLAGSLEVVPGIEDVGVVGDLARLEGRWTSSQWVTHLTAWFGEGGTQCLVGTRGLLGEGWDAPWTTTLVDLTTVTTGTAVVQTRGRALRLDPDHPDKVAQIWSVVCVHDGHVAGGADWDRFARKHRGHFSVDEQGAVVDGVAGVDSAFSEHHPPPVEELDAIGARMLVRAEDRDGVRAAWQDPAHGAHQDRVGHLVRVRPTRTPGPVPALPDGERPLTETVRSWEQQRGARPGRGWAVAPPVAVVLLLVVLAVLGAPVGALVALGVVLGLAAAAGAVALAGRAALQGAADHEVTVATVAAAVADGLHRAGTLPAGAEAVVARTSPDGRLGFLLRIDDEPASARYAAALEEVLSPLTSPRYLVPRRTHTAPRGLEGLRRGLADRGRQLDHDRAWHAVPSVVAGHRRTADAYAAAWDHWVGGGDAVYAHSPEGTGVLAAHRGSDPFGAECTVRRTWG